MIDKLNIPIHNKNTSRVEVTINLGRVSLPWKAWSISEYDVDDNPTYYGNSTGYWTRSTYKKGKRVKYENSRGEVVEYFFSDDGLYLGKKKKLYSE